MPTSGRAHSNWVPGVAIHPAPTRSLRSRYPDSQKHCLGCVPSSTEDQRLAAWLQSHSNNWPPLHGLTQTAAQFLAGSPSAVAHKSIAQSRHSEEDDGANEMTQTPPAAMQPHPPVAQHTSQYRAKDDAISLNHPDDAHMANQPPVTPWLMPTKRLIAASIAIR